MQIFCFLTVGVHSQSRHVLAPQNTAHVIGQATPPLYFNCSIEFTSYEDDFLWDVLANRPPGGVAVAVGDANAPVMLIPAFQNEYDVEGTNLIVKNADFNDAGAYLCRNANHPETLRTAQAIVFGKLI